MSHELRTPLNSLLILSKLLLENEHGNLSDKQLEFARTIYTAGTDLLQLISDILDLSKIEAGKMEILPDLVSLADVQAYVTSTFDPIAADKGLRFTIDADPALPATIVTDEQRLEQVLRNLLSNAFKFTEEGGVTLGDRAPLGGRIAFAVSDTGVGIPPDKLQVIFEAFQQADGTTSRKYGGTGLGLSISRELARALGGEIEWPAPSGEGTIFTLVLPLATSDNACARGARPGRWAAGCAVWVRPSARVVPALEISSSEAPSWAIGWRVGSKRSAQHAHDALPRRQPPRAAVLGALRNHGSERRRRLTAFRRRQGTDAQCRGSPITRDGSRAASGLHA